ncbi:MAG TPA: glycosyltransferase family 4 protein [Pyrinomonadaceae bacterium]|nr:glycosyltransferase family 4 protein [Pyrinomonadaceae bacterium]
MNVLALCSYPVEAAATRYRVAQFITPLRERGIEVTLRPLLDGRTFASLYRRAEWPRTAAALAAAALRRVADIWHARKFDAVLVQREALLVGPPLVEWLTTRAQGRPLVLDLDDATYVRYISQSYGRLASALKWFGKTDELIRWASVVTCGNRFIAEYVRAQGARAIVIPTVVDTDLFRPADPPPTRAVPVVGWIGTHSTYAYLETIFPVLQELARVFQFRLRVVGAGRERIELPGVEVENLPWRLEREVADFQSLDIGLYPLGLNVGSPRAWLEGKSGFKAIQYMAVGTPFVVTPIGVCAEMGAVGQTHLTARTPAEWHATLERLLTDEGLRRTMGAAGRQHALDNYTLPVQADKLAAALRAAVK